MESFKTGTTSISSICGPQSCTSDTDLRIIRTWLLSYCGSSSSISDGSGSTGNNSETKSWISGHFKWIIMLIVIFTFIFGAWILACIFRKRYLRRKESEGEKATPVAWGPHQMQGATGGYSSNVSMIEKIYAIPNVSNFTPTPGETAATTQATTSSHAASADAITVKEDKKSPKMNI
ncbi:hypothetical protein K3495_g524 [Podosphaera aphanis]|nr:hypothetical protein K3495_g524 [Podosphaera aphanis]